MNGIFLTLAAAGLLLLAPAARACSCLIRDPASAFNDAKAVFVGRMLGGTEKLSLKDEGGKPYHLEAGDVRLTVEEVFKGDLPSVITVEVASMNGTSCGPYGLARDEQGRFRLQGFTGETYWLEARGTMTAGGGDDYFAFHSPPRKIVLTENLREAEIVLSEKGLTSGCGK
ncbi:MAG TPA: hypothetical protein VN256_25440 [Pyrinomonadaceae bacterium]|nr:hypothetical protein [Pyrinomonadaceae bacterium]